MSRHLALPFLTLLLFTSSAQAVHIGDFPGLKELAEKADAIVILRVDHHFNPNKNPTLYTTHHCYIYQTLKGEIPANEHINVRLMDTRSSFVTPYALYSTHLMFLTKKRTPDEPTEYRTIEYQGANIRISPFGNEKAPEGDTLVDQLKAVLKNTIGYNEETHQKEKEFLEAALK